MSSLVSPGDSAYYVTSRRVATTPRIDLDCVSKPLEGETVTSNERRAEGRLERDLQAGPRAGRAGCALPRRYEIYFADLNIAVGGEIRKVRPVVLVSQNEMNQTLDTVVVCLLTSTLHPRWRSRLQISCAGKGAEIAVEQIRTLNKRRLKKKIDELPHEAASQLRGLITEMYGH